MRSLGLLADHLHLLAVDFIDYASETFEDSKNLYEYAAFEYVKQMSAEIIKHFHCLAHCFDKLTDQIWLLSCNNLKEVLDVLKLYKDEGLPPKRPDFWDPEDAKEANALDTHVLLNLPDEVINVIAEAAKKAQDDQSYHMRTNEKHA